MPTNDFLTFGAAAGANVMTQASYVALTARSTGFTSGTASSAQLNKAWRQSSIIAAVVAQAISDITGADAVDDGTTATLVANLKAAIRAQSIGVAGTFTKLKMSVTTDSASATLTADEIVVKSAIGGLSYIVPNFSKTINLATTGVGGMDTGSAPANSFVSIYAIYNPSTQVSALLACNQSVSSGSVYTGANMPSGYTASALVSAWRTSATGLLVAGSQSDRSIDVTLATIINTTSVLTNSSVSMNSILPIAAVSFSGVLQCGAASANSSVTVGLASTSSGFGRKSCGATSTVANAVTQCAFSDMAVPTSRTTYVSSTVDIGSISQAAAFLTSYKI